MWHHRLGLLHWAVKLGWRCKMAAPLLPKPWRKVTFFLKWSMPFYVDSIKWFISTFHLVVVHLLSLERISDRDYFRNLFLINNVFYLQFTRIHRLSEVQTSSCTLPFYQRTSHQPPQFHVCVCVCVPTHQWNGYVGSDQAKNSHHTPGLDLMSWWRAHTPTLILQIQCI